MASSDDRRLIEDYLPIQGISKEASREKSVRKGHISTLHLWWARRPLVACRAAVYGALVPADQWVPNVDLKNPPADTAKAEAMTNGAKKGLNRRHAKQFVERLCRYPKASEPLQKADIDRAVAEAQKHILTAHAGRLTAELEDGRKSGKLPAWVEEFKFSGKRITMEDIVAGRAPRPRVLDMFAGGGAIPLEALRLGCEAYALDLNPVAHIIELCTLVYPQKYGRPDPNARGMTGPKNAKGETTWGGLADEVRYWGNWVLAQVRREIGDLYPPIQDPKAGKSRKTLTDPQYNFGGKSFEKKGQQELHVETPLGYLTPVAYLWTRTVRCKNPACGATVPLVKQTWLCKKDGRYVALQMHALNKEKMARFEVVESESEKGLGFDPTAFSKGGNATCPFCGTVADVDHVKAEGWKGRIGHQPMAIVGKRAGSEGKVYLSPDHYPNILPDEATIQRRTSALCTHAGLTIPAEPIANLPSECNDNSLGITVRPYGVRTFGNLYSPRQLLCLLAFVAAVREAEGKLRQEGYAHESCRAISTVLGGMVDKLADFNSVQCTWNYTGGRGVGHSFTRQTLAMTWDYAETDPFNVAGASWPAIVDDIPAGIEMLVLDGTTAPTVRRGSATSMLWADCSVDAVVTDPPYYDNVPYADISDFFYIWLKRTVGHLHSEHFATEGTPKKNEAIADATRHGGDKDVARTAYETMMRQAFREASRILKPGGPMVVVYAHKTTLGWSTLVDALRQSGFEVTEAWPMDTEMKARMRAMESAALASSIFLVARKRVAKAGIGNYEDDVQPELQRIVRERVETLWEMEIAGADLVIACVGAGLRAFTKYEKVEYPNGEEVPAERFLAEVETAVLETILGKLSKEAAKSAKETGQANEVNGKGNGHGRDARATSLQGVDPATRFYVLWRYTYRSSELDAGEAIIFANGTHVELDGHGGLSQGGRPLVEKKKAKYHLRDYTERGDDAKLGMPAENGQSAPLIDALHRTLWLMDNQPGGLDKFFSDARPNLEQIRLVAQALAGPALKGGELADVSPSGELGALARLTANWRSLTEGVTGGLFDGRRK